MLKIRKKLSYNFKDFFSDSQKSFPRRVVLSFFLLFLLYFVFPLSLAVFLKLISVNIIYAFYLITFIAVVIVFKINSKKTRLLKFKHGQVQEKINVLKDAHSRDLINNSALVERILRYASLKRIIEKINKDLKLEYVANNLADIAYFLVADEKGTCLLYLVDRHAQKLILAKTKKADRQSVIKTKEGDIFDFWVLRHMSPLLIEDIKKDYRFDLEKLNNLDKRQIHSLISAPFITESGFLGILRLDNPESGDYGQDDLRLLAAIADIGAVALENGELFAKTQDLAIHDGLTGLYTKEYFLEHLRAEVKRSLRHEGDLSLLMLDIDFFKNYNDKFGHAAGDIVLKNLSLNLADFFKKHKPIISRFGGEEFSILLPEINMDSARQLAEELRLRIELVKIILRRQESHITISIGVASLGKGIVDGDDLIRLADRAMYEAKQKGRNRVVCWSEPH